MNNSIKVKKVSGADHPKYIILVKCSQWDLAYDFSIWEQEFALISEEDIPQAIARVRESYKDMVESNSEEEFKDEGNIDAVAEELEFDILDRAFSENSSNTTVGRVNTSINPYNVFEVEVNKIFTV